jgi:hypothetical protein
MTLPASLTDVLAVLLLAQGLMGGFDTLYNHELVERLPHRVAARREIGLHSLRELNYGLLFLGLAWFAWHGTTVLLVAAVLVFEILVTGFDEWVENRTRVLPNNERILHMLLTMNYGAIAAVLAAIGVDWVGQPSEVIAAPLPLHWPISLLGLASLAWSVRDGLAFVRLGRAAVASA